MSENTLDIIVNAQDNASGPMGKIGSAIENAFADPVATALVAITAISTAVFAFSAASIVHFSEVGDAVEKMAERTGLSTEAVSALRVAADASGTSIETVESAVKKMQLTMSGTAPVSNEMKKAFDGIDLSVDNFKKAAPDYQFQLLAQAIGKVQDPAQKTKLAVEAFGKAGADLIPLMDSGKFSMHDWELQAQKLGVSFDALAAQHAADLNDALGAVKTAMSGLSLTLGGELAPYLTDFINKVVLPAVPVLIKLSKDGFDLVRQAAMSVWSEIKTLWSYLQQTGVITAFQNAFKALSDVYTKQLWPALLQLWASLQPFLPLLKTVGEYVGIALVGAFMLLIAVFTEIVSFDAMLIKAFASVVDFLAKHFKPEIDGVTSVIKGLSGTIQDMIKFIGNALTAISNLSAAAGKVAGAIGGAISGHRAVGGPVEAGQSYTVGEGGSETFIPATAGTIIPHGQFAGGGGGGANISIVMNVAGINSDMDARAVGQQVGDQILSRLKSNLKF